MSMGAQALQMLTAGLDQTPGSRLLSLQAAGGGLHIVLPMLLAALAAPASDHRLAGLAALVALPKVSLPTLPADLCEGAR